MPGYKRLARIAAIIEQVDVRCMAADGPVTPTLKEMTQAEISEIYGLASADPFYCTVTHGPATASDNQRSEGKEQ